MKLREGDSWVPADEYGRSLKQGIGVNLLVKDVAFAPENRTRLSALAEAAGRVAGASADVRAHQCSHSSTSVREDHRERLAVWRA